MRVYSFFCDEQSPKTIEVEYHARFQIPTFQILGLPAPEIQEARERIMAAFQAAEWEFPKKKVIVNLAPSSIRKSGTGHDLAIAIKILSENEELDWCKRVLAWGELGLDGSIKAVGRMAALLELLLQTSSCDRIELLILSPPDAVALKHLLFWRKSVGLRIPEKLELFVAEQLKDLSPKLKPVLLQCESTRVEAVDTHQLSTLLPLAAPTERLLKISLIGKHHVLLLGPKGIGKSESLHWFKALSPPSKPRQVWERLLHSESRNLPLSFNPPIRQVHAQVKPAHLLGSYGLRGYQAGELALAHGGQFVADEFMEWPRDAKECLREPLQNKKMTLTRVRGSIEAPCDFQLIATGNLCPCGGLPSTFRLYDSSKRYRCRCRMMEIEKYLQRLSGPILDRIDLTFIMTDTERSSEKLDPAVLRDEINAADCFIVRTHIVVALGAAAMVVEGHARTDNVNKCRATVLDRPLDEWHQLLLVA